MNKLFRWFLIVLVALLSCATAMAKAWSQQNAQAPTTGPSLESTFEGILDVGTAKLRPVPRVSKAGPTTGTCLSEERIVAKMKPL